MNLFKKVLSMVLSGCMAFSAAAVTGIVSVAAETEEQSQTYETYAQDTVEGSAILHCFDWSFDNIRENMADIAAAGYTAVQTSPIQKSKQATYGDSNSVWWVYYQPCSFTIEDEENRSALGDKQQFAAMCEEAHKYGIHVIVDVVANHLGNDGDYTKSAAIPEEIRDNDDYWHANWNVKADTSIREESINYSLGGLPDLNTENSYIQGLVLDYLKECIDAGADGFRFDAAKHIGVDGTGGDGDYYTFWSNTVPAAKSYYLSTSARENDRFDSLYCYGEILDDTKTSSYAQYLDAVTDTVGNGIRASVVSGDVSGAARFTFYNTLSAGQKVLWAESHDTYSNESKESTYVSDADINKTWALVASRKDAAALYFARTDGYRGGQLGDICSYQWKSDEVAAVNKFQTIFSGKSEYLSSFGSIAYNERGTKGIVLVNVKGNEGEIAVPVYRMTDGTYTDQITGNSFTVSNGIISGTIGSTGIAVVYDPDNLDETENTTASTLYLKPGIWDEYDALFEMYLFDGNNNSKWVSMSDTDGDNIYEADVPEGDWSNVIFCRMNPNGTPHSWESKWNQTGNLDIPTDSNVLYTISDWNDGSWGALCSGHTYGEPVWTWGGLSSAIATFICTNCGYHENIAASVERLSADAEYIGYRATVTFNDQTYHDYNGEDRVDNSTLYLKPNENWVSDDARFAVYVWQGAISEWFDMTYDANDDIYYVDIEELYNYENAIFCRMNPSYTDNQWNSSSSSVKYVWNKTSDLVIPIDGNNCYTVADGAWSEGGGEWSTFISVCDHEYGSPVWAWSDDYSTASATFTCANCGEEVTVTDSAPTAQYVSSTCIKTASVTGIDNAEYTTTLTLPMIVRIDNSVADVDFQFEYADLLYYLYTQIVDHEETIDISSYGLSVNDEGYISNALFKCYPDISFLFSGISFGRTSLDEDATIVSISPIYSVTSNEADEMQSNFNTKALWYLSKVNDSMDDFTKALVLHDQLVLNNYYQVQIGDYGDEDYVFSSNYTFMVNNWGRCDNYTQVYAYLLAQLGIKSEIISSSAMDHSWLKICLDGSYYNIDITWDDSLFIFNDSTAQVDRPNKALHKYFLLSDELIGDEEVYGTDGYHYDYQSYYTDSDTYDSYNNIHSIENPVFYIDGELYTVYENENHYGVIACYDPDTDSLDDIYYIEDKWAATNGYWVGNFSDIAEYDGILYFNGEKNIYIFDPRYKTVTEYFESDSQLYGLYIEDGILYGLTADKPNNTPTPVRIGECPSAESFITNEFVTVNGASLSLSGKIALNFYADAVVKSGAYVRITHNDDSEIIPITNDLKTSSGYKFTYLISAKQIHDNVTFEVFDQNDNQIELYKLSSGEKVHVDNNSFTYSAADYINYVKTNYSSTDNLYKLVAALDTYGSYSQDYLNYYTDTATASDDRIDISGVNADSIVDYKYNKVSGTMPSGISLYGYSLVVDSDNSFRLYFTSDAPDSHTYKLNDEDVTYSSANNMYYVEVPNIAAKELGDRFTITVDGFEMSFSALSYAYLVLTKSNDDGLCNLVSSLVKYYKEVSVYDFSA